MQKQNFVTNQRTAVKQLVEAIHELDALRLQWDAQDLLNEITQDDLIAENADLTPAMLADVWNSHAAINALLDTGHRTNLYRLLP